VWLLPSAAIATAAAAAAFVLIAPDDPKTQTLQPGGTPRVSTTAEPGVSPAPAVPDDGGMPLDTAAIWPFTAPDQLASWRSAYPYAESSLDVGRHFVEDYLGLQGVEVSQTCVSCAVLQLKVGGASVGEVTLVRVGVGFASGHGTQVFTVVGVGGTDLTVTSPKAGALVTSPTAVTGRITGVHENVMLRLLTDAGDELATVGAPAGQEVPWSETLSWSRTDWTHGAVVGVTRSDKDGAVTRVVAVPVTRATGSPTASFAGVVDGHVSLFDSTTGRQLRQLTYPPAGKSDVVASWAGSSLVWVRTAGASACVNELDRLDGTKASTVATSTSVRYDSPALSPDGTRLAWVETSCGDPSVSEIVLTGGAGTRRIPAQHTDYVRVYDVTDDGTAVVLARDPHDAASSVVGVLPNDATTLGALRPLVGASGCDLASGAAADAGGVVAFETCGAQVRLTHFALDGHRQSTEPSFAAEPPSSLSVRDGRYLVWLFGGDQDGSIATYADGRFTTLIENAGPGCSSSGDQKGCVRSPDW
jgi:hypothetical protein